MRERARAFVGQSLMMPKERLQTSLGTATATLNLEPKERLYKAAVPRSWPWHINEEHTVAWL